MKNRLLKREFLRYLFDRKILFVFIILLVLNAFTVFADEGTLDYSKNYRKLNKELESIRPEERVSFLEERMDRENKEQLFDNENTEVNYSVLLVCRDLLTEISETADYDSYVKGVIENAEMLESIYSENEDQSKQKLEKTKKDYKKLFGLDVSYTASRGFSKAVSSRITMLLFLVAIFRIKWNVIPGSG